MEKVLAWFKKYFIVFLAFALVGAAILMNLDMSGLNPAGGIAGKGKGQNQRISGEEEFEALCEGTVLPLTYRATGTISDEPSPVFGSVTVLATFQEEAYTEHGTDRAKWEFLLAVTADAVYLRSYEYELDERKDRDQEYREREFEYYVKGSDIFARCVQYRGAEDGVNITKEMLQEEGQEALALMAFGELRGKWVRVNGTEAEKFAKYDFKSYFGEFDAFRASRLKRYFEQYTFEGGEEPKITCQNPRNDMGGEGAYEVEVASVQYKYINNTVIEDVSAKKTYAIENYLKEGK